MNDIEGPDIFDTLHNLSDDDASFFLTNLASSFKEYAQVIAVCVLLHHINVGASLDSLMQANGVRATNHAMNLDFFVDAVQVLL